MATTPLLLGVARDQTNVDLEVGANITPRDKLLQDPKNLNMDWFSIHDKALYDFLQLESELVAAVL